VEPRYAASGEPSAAGSAAETKLPPPPTHGYTGRPTSQLPLAPPRQDDGPKGWRKFFAIVGIVFAFPFLLTIPGWVALSAYRKWKAGERGQPTLLIAWGVIGPVLFVLISFAQLRLLTDAKAPQNPVQSPAGGASSEGQPAPDGFVASSGPDGWTRYASEGQGFSISLPPKWAPYLTSDPGTPNALTARDYGPPYRGAVGAGLWVTVWPLSGQEVPQTYWRNVLRNISGDPHTVSVQMSRTRLPAGSAFVFHVVTTRKGLTASTTMYALLHGPMDYRLIFEAPVKHAITYSSEFNDIARTFQLVE
jgi:hypothetical protein